MRLGPRPGGFSEVHRRVCTDEKGMHVRVCARARDELVSRYTVARRCRKNERDI